MTRAADASTQTDLLARALRENVAFVPGRAAFVDGRGASSMRLNFSGVGEDEIREGIRRIGEVVREQVGLYGTLTGARAVSTAAAPPGRPARDRAASDQSGEGTVPRGSPEELAKILRLPAHRRAS